MADFVGDRVEEDYAGVERKWNTAATQTNRILAHEFNGIDTFPFASVEKSLLAVHERLVLWTTHTLEALAQRYPSLGATP